VRIGLPAVGGGNAIRMTDGPLNHLDPVAVDRRSTSFESLLSIGRCRHFAADELFESDVQE
jgi:hypothetical protein